MRVNLSRPARADLQIILANIAKDSPRSARRFLLAVEKLAGRICAFPEMGGRFEIDNLELEGLRVFTIPRFKKYLLFYRVHDEEIEIVRILHGARDILAILEG